MSNFIEKLRTQFRENIVAHDFPHLERVAKTAVFLARQETCIDIDVVQTAAYLHDFHRLVERRAGRHVSPENAEPELKTFAAEHCDLAPARLEAVLSCIRFTERYACAGDDLRAAAPSREAMIVRDADMLDALGAVGIARAFMFGGYLGEPLWDAETPVRGQFVHGEAPSIVHHFYEKLFRLEEEMLTSSARALAAERTAYMRQFIYKLKRELKID